MSDWPPPKSPEDEPAADAGVRPPWAEPQQPTVEPHDEPSADATGAPPAGLVRPWRAALLVAVAVLAGFVGGRLGGDAEPPVQPTISSSTPIPAAADADLAALYREVAASVVQIESAGRQGTGSGVIIDETGSILTNNHVVGADGVRVQMADGTRLRGRVVGRDAQRDLALVRLTDPPRDLKPAPLGNSDRVRVGDTVVAIGAPFGLQNSMSAGVVSAMNRTFAGDGRAPMRGLIQTDAAINPGNSGGPLFNTAGEVIGITTAIESPIRGSVGVGFAVPINQAQASLPLLVRGRTIEHPYLGVQGAPADGGGVQVAAILPGSSAADSDLRAGDVITAIDGREVNTIEQLAAALDRYSVGDRVDLTVRRNGRTIEIPVTLRTFRQGG